MHTHYVFFSSSIKDTGGILQWRKTFIRRNPLNRANYCFILNYCLFFLETRNGLCGLAMGGCQGHLLAEEYYSLTCSFMVLHSY